jgi:diguanylate cyclase (GGDEF)-like protein
MREGDNVEPVRRYDAAVAGVVPETAGLLGLLLFIDTPIEAFVLSGTKALIMTIVVGLSAAGLLLTAWKTWRRPVAHGEAHRITAIFGAVLAGNCLLELALTHQSRQTSNVMLTVVALAAALLNTAWAAGMVGGTVAVWAVLAVTRLQGQPILHWVLGILASIILGAAINLARRRGLDQLDAAVSAAHEAAVHDALTGLLNRRGMMVLGPALMASGRRAGNAVYASFVDVDGLKTVNDRGGHAAGDAVLTAVADALASVVRAGDIVARFGGDEFCVLGQGPGAAPVDLERRVSERLAEEPPVPIDLWPAKVSVGGAMLAPWDEGNLETLLAAADREMYRRRALRRQQEGVARGRRD